MNYLQYCLLFRKLNLVLVKFVASYTIFFLGQMLGIQRQSWRPASHRMYDRRKSQCYKPLSGILIQFIIYADCFVSSPLESIALVAFRKGSAFALLCFVWLTTKFDHDSRKV